MRKKDEATLPSCWNNAGEEEMMFILLGRDVAAPKAIRVWADERVRLGLNTESDEKIIEARACADTMDKERPR